MYTPRYLKPVPFGAEHFNTLAAAVKRTLPHVTIHLIADRSNEIANMEEAMSPPYHITASWPLPKYLSPFMQEEESNGLWSGYYNPKTHEIKSTTELKDPDTVEWTAFSATFSDIRRFIYDMIRGASFPIYDLFATPDSFLEHDDDNSHLSRKEIAKKLTALAGKSYSIRSAMGRYTGSLDGLTTKLIRTVEYYGRRDAALAADPMTDLTQIRPISFDVPTNSQEVYEVMSIFVATWLRSNLVFKFLDARRKAKTDDEFNTIQNELVSKWWNRDNTPYSDDELFQLATKNLLMRGFLVASQVKDIRGLGYTEGVNYGTPELLELIEAMQTITNDLRTRIGNIPAAKGDHHAEAVKTCYDIISANKD